MMKMKRRILAQAVLLAVSTFAMSWNAVACPSNVAKPFTSGPLDAQGMFSDWVVDMNGVALKVCTDSNTADGNPPPCFYDPIEPGNALSATLGRGVEAFVFLANSVFTTTGAAPVDAVIVMGVETAFLSPTVTAGFQTQFQRLRTRLNVAAVGIYTVETPWGKSIYRVDTLLPPGNGQNRAEVSEPIDISFGPNSSVPGLVSPFLVANPPIPGFGQAEGYIGDGLTPTTVKGSPCGDNFIRITATGLDGVTPIDINNGSNVYTDPNFTIMGKLAPVAKVPLSIGSVYYTRNSQVDTVTVMAEGSTSASQLANATVEINGVVNPLAKDVNRFYGTVPTVAPVALPQQVSVTASDPGIPSLANTMLAPMTDLVTISSAVARCSGTGPAKCVLTVNASSSDDGSGADGAATLTLQHSNTPFVVGSASTTSAAIPASVTVVSSKGGVAVKPVTVINQ
jgi:hypothetical protein